MVEIQGSLRKLFLYTCGLCHRAQNVGWLCLAFATKFACSTKIKFLLLKCIHIKLVLLTVEATRMDPSQKVEKICNFNNTCGHKHDGSLTYKRLAQYLKVFRQKFCIAVIFNNLSKSKARYFAKKLERNLNLICNSSWLTHIPKSKHCKRCRQLTKNQGKPNYENCGNVVSIFFKDLKEQTLSIHILYIYVHLMN